MSPRKPRGDIVVGVLAYESWTDFCIHVHVQTRIYDYDC